MKGSLLKADGWGELACYQRHFNLILNVWHLGLSTNCGWLQ